MNEESREASTLFVQSLATGVAVMRAFDTDHAAMSLPEIAAAAGISKSAAQRFAYTLETLGLLKKDPVSKRYALSAGNLDLGCQYLHSHPLLERANPYLLELNQRSGETVNLAEPVGDCMVYIGRFASLVRMIMHMPVGQRIPMYCASTGRMYLSTLCQEDARSVLEQSARFRYTASTLTDVEQIMEQVAQAAADGYAYCKDEYYQGDLALSVPVRDSSGQMVAALNVSVSSTKWTPKRAISKFVPMMLETARLISTTAPNVAAQRPFKAMVPRILKT